MQVIKMVSDDSMEYELYDFATKRYLAISYVPTNQHPNMPYIYCVNSDVYSVQELVQQIPIWANKERRDRVVIYTKSSEAVNSELINALKEMTLIHPTGLNNHAYYFIKAYVICESYDLSGVLVYR